MTRCNIGFDDGFGRYGDEDFTVIRAVNDVDVIRASFQHFEAHRALFTVLAGGGIPGKHMRRCMDGQREYQAAFAGPLARAAADGALRADVPISIQADFLTGAVHGVVRGWARQEGAMNLVDQAQAVVDLFLRGATRAS